MLRKALRGVLRRSQTASPYQLPRNLRTSRPKMDSEPENDMLNSPVKTPSPRSGSPIDKVTDKANVNSNFVKIDDILTWPAYFKTNEDVKIISDKYKPRYSPDEKLNNRISIYQGDITKLRVDAIVNAANENLIPGGGVCGCIHRAAGPELFNECRQLNGCKTGNAKITDGYQLPAKHVIHTVGPIGKNETLLMNCYENCLKIVEEKELKSVAFPCISTGIYGYPIVDATHVALNAVRCWLEKENNADKIDRIIFCVFLDKDKYIYEQLVQLYFPLIT